MRATNPGLGVRPEGFQSREPTNVGSIARFASRSPFSDSEERMFASQLLEVASEAELEQVLRDLSTKARRGSSLSRQHRPGLWTGSSRQSPRRPCLRLRLPWVPSLTDRGATRKLKSSAPSSIRPCGRKRGECPSPTRT